MKEKEAEVLPFFSKVYSDDEMRRLSQIYCIEDYGGEKVPCSLGWVEAERMAARYLTITKVDTKLVGVKKGELSDVLSRHNEEEWLPHLIEIGYLNEKVIDGEEVIFATEKLLENQGFKKR